MKKSEIKNLINTAINTQGMCRVLFKYDMNYSYFFPIKSSERLFLAAVEDDFILDGFSIRKFCDVKAAELKNDKIVEIMKKEGVLEKLATPKIDLTDWYHVFLSLKELGKNIIIEKESLNDDECEFGIGHIEKVLKSKVVFRDFDADSVWQKELWDIPFSAITSVTFSCRYVDIFSKYV